MKCDNCPARSKDSNFTGCLALKHSIQDYNGCNRSEEKIRSELVQWLKTASKSEIERFSFWKSCGLNSHWVPAVEMKGQVDNNKTKQVKCIRDFVEDATVYWCEGKYYEVVCRDNDSGGWRIKHEYGEGIVYDEDFDDYFEGDDDDED